MVKNPPIINELKKALEDLPETWSRQTNYMDNITHFIYSIHSYGELCKEMDAEKFDANQRAYTIHRWFNTEISILHEQLFIKHGAEGASFDVNKMQHTDCYIQGKPFDIKSTVYPSRCTPIDPDELDTREKRNELIRWFYHNQSRGQRYCFNNRIFIVCCGDSVIERNSLKLDYSQVELKVKAYMKYLLDGGKVNELNVSAENGEMHRVKSELILIKPYATKLCESPEELTCPKCGSHYDLKVSTVRATKGSIVRECASCGNIEKI